MYQGAALGVYTKVPDEPNMYQQKGGDYYMYQDKKQWLVGPRLTNCNKTFILSCVATWVAAIKTSDILGVGDAWSYGKDKDWVNDDTTIQFIPLSNPLVACITCNRIMLITTTPWSPGVFTRIPGKFSAGRPVYRSSIGGGYLMVKNEYTSYGVWDDPDKRLHAGAGDDGERFVRSGSAPTCVTQLGREVGRGGHGWLVREDDQWVDNHLTTQCLD